MHMKMIVRASRSQINCQKLYFIHKSITRNSKFIMFHYTVLCVIAVVVHAARLTSQLLQRRSCVWFSRHFRGLGMMIGLLSMLVTRKSKIKGQSLTSRLLLWVSSWRRRCRRGYQHHCISIDRKPGVVDQWKALLDAHDVFEAAFTLSKIVINPPWSSRLSLYCSSRRRGGLALPTTILYNCSSINWKCWRCSESRRGHSRC